MYKIRATVVDMHGKCYYHKLGDYVELENDLLTIPDGKRYVLGRYLQCFLIWLLSSGNMMSNLIGCLMLVLFSVLIKM